MNRQLLVLAGAVLVHSAVLVGVDLVDVGRIARAHHVRHEVLAREAARCQVVTPVAPANVAPAAVAPIAPPAPPPPAAPAPAAGLAILDSDIITIDATHHVVQRALVDRMLADPMTAASGARIVPAVRDGKPDGFKLYAIRPDSVYARLGFFNGDTIETINGIDLTTADKALETYTTLRSATRFAIHITRHGVPMTLDFEVASLASDAFIRDHLIHDRVGHVWVSPVLVHTVLADPLALAGDMRLVPAMRDGKPAGLKLYAIRAGSLFDQLGFQNGDTVRAVNHFDLTSSDQALGLYARLRSVQPGGMPLAVEITRKGAPETLQISI